MHYSPILVLVLITILSLSGAYSERYPRDYRKSNYESPLNDEPQDEVLDIGNGNYRKNVIVMEPGNSQPNPLGNRFNADPTRQRTYTTNIGNGNHNHNIIDFGASAPETSDPNGENSGGTSFVHNGRQQSSQVEAQLKSLLNLATQLQQTVNNLIQEAEKLNI
ncbi:uncharacterized protein LOC123866399 isoform X7 [Maniola jurtina]|uniref:uncharacterized protein LOC123866399 isoform X7 n=1 Tax=Maniola jurtina TaxID=191418 RepID=UPI001E68A52C|nr:uncharacterized protein LOC123866399 isoform X7 [Maniola jurtina]